MTLLFIDAGGFRGYLIGYDNWHCFCVGRVVHGETPLSGTEVRSQRSHLCVDVVPGSSSSNEKHLGGIRPDHLVTSIQKGQTRS